MAGFDRFPQATGMTMAPSYHPEIGIAMAESVQFPRQGSEYVPLPSGSTGNRVLAHTVQTIATTPEQAYALYSRPETLHIWQEGLVSVTQTGDRTMHWVMEDPTTRKQVEFDVEVVEAVEGVRHVSRILNGPFAGTEDTVTFETHPAGRGTIVRWVSNYAMPGGVVTKIASSILSRGPQQLVIENLRHLKQLLEAGEIPSVEGQPAGPRGVMGQWKRFLMGENMPTPPGTSDRSRPQDLPKHSEGPNAWVVGGVAVAAAAGAWYGVRKLIED